MTRYIEVRETLAREIAQGRYPVGQRFPTEHELCERFSVSRYTIREALRNMQQDGVLARQRGAGTVVTFQGPQPYIQTVASLSEFDKYAVETRFECLVEGVVVAGRGLADKIGCLHGSRWLHFGGRRYHKDDANPLCWTDVYLSKELIRYRRAIRNAKGPFFERVRQIKGIAAEAVIQEIKATAVTSDFAGHLNCPVGAPTLLVRRMYLKDSGEPFEVSLSLHPANRYVSSIRLTRRRPLSLHYDGEHRDKEP